MQHIPSLLQKLPRFADRLETFTLAKSHGLKIPQCARGWDNAGLDETPPCGSREESSEESVVFRGRVRAKAKCDWWGVKTRIQH